MAAYTLPSYEEIDQILSLYGCSRDQSQAITSMEHGISNSNIALSTHEQGKILLKISNAKDDNSLREEMKILELLHQKNFELAPYPLLTKNEDTIYSLNVLSGVIYPFYPSEKKNISTQTISDLALSLAKLNSVQVQEDDLRPFKKVGYDALKIIDYVHSQNALPDFVSFYKKYFSSSLEKIILNPNSSMGICHGDLYFDNALFYQGKLSKILDFEQAGFGEQILDMGISISGSCLEYNQINSQLVKTYIEHYQEIKPLNRWEEKHFTLYILLGFFSIALWRIERFNHKKITDGKEDSYKELLALAAVFGDQL